MKFILMFKTPDVLDDIDRKFEGHEQLELMKDIARKFVKWDEYIYVEFDTDTGTATVLEKS